MHGVLLVCVYMHFPKFIILMIVSMGSMTKIFKKAKKPWLVWFSG